MYSLAVALTSTRLLGLSVHSTQRSYPLREKFSVRWRWSLFALSVLLSCAGTYAMPLQRALASATLRHSDPRPDSTLDHSPMEIMTWFSVPITAGSDLRIFDDDFSDMANGKPQIDPDDVSLLRLPVVHLPAGKYTVKWRAEGRDGSISEGEYKFTVASNLSLTTLLPLLSGVGAVLLTLLGSGVGWLLLRRMRQRNL